MELKEYECQRKGLSVSRKVGMSFIGIFLLLYLFNCLAPLYFGDDYVYSFIWEGHSLYEPLSEKAVRISSWKDLFASQWSHYFTWSGRTVNHTLAQFFLWKGKAFFNICNALAATVLVAEINWCMNKGVISKNLNASMLYWIIFFLWSFTPAFGTVFLWLDGACNYLWPTVLLIGFAIPYIKKYYFFTVRMGKGLIYDFFIFIFGLVAGWTNENTICWIILILVLFIIKYRKEEGMENWLYFGLVGLMAGYALLMFSPGNIVRLYAEQNGNTWLTWDRIKGNFSLFGFIFFYFQLFLWYFCLRSLFCLRNWKSNKSIFKKEVLLIKIFCVIAFGMTAIMIFSPGFPPRSGFPGTVWLIIATGILLRLQNEYGVTVIQYHAKQFLKYTSIVYFIITFIISFQHYYKMHLYANEIVACAKQIEMQDKVLKVKPVIHDPSLQEHVMSAYHVVGFGISEDLNEWKNVAFARYYGIKGICMEKANEKDKK